MRSLTFLCLAHLTMCQGVFFAHAQTRAVIGVQEAQMPPHIDREQLRSPSVDLDAGSLAPPAPLASLQKLAEATPSASAGERKQQAEAAWQLGLLKLHGLHVPLGPAEANSWFERAHALGHPLAAAGLAWCAVDGCGHAPRPAQAQKWLQELRRSAPGRAAYLEWLLIDALAPLDTNAALKSTAPVTAGNVQRHKEQTLQRAVKANDPHARVEWGLELAAEGKVKEAMAQFQQAAPHSEAASRNIKVLQEQSSQTTRTHTSTGQTGGAWQTFRQARVYHRGEGVPANYTEAIRLYKRAADMGSTQAKRMLALIYSRPQENGNIDIAWMQQLAYADVTEDGVTPLHVPNAPVNLQRDPTPLHDYIDPRWRKAP
ncbi:MAG TPA: hypothetical protein VIG85_04740 [Comamonas sp.]